MVATPRCLFVVSHTFSITGRGLVLVPGIKPEGDEQFRIGDVVELRKPGNAVARVKISGIEILNPIPHDGRFPIMLQDVIEKSDVPIGTEVWSVRGTTGAVKT